MIQFDLRHIEMIYTFRHSRMTVVCAAVTPVTVTCATKKVGDTHKKKRCFNISQLFQRDIVKMPLRFFD